VNIDIKTASKRRKKIIKLEQKTNSNKISKTKMLDIILDYH
jgi:hypothetical protein